MDNKIAVALNKSMYVWDANTGDIAEIFCMGDDNEDESNDDYISSTAWLNEYGSGVLAVGNSLNIVEIWDVNTCTRIRRMRSHTSRVGSLSWNNHILTSGARNGAIHHHDVRVAEHHVGTLTMHAQEVCGLKWNSEGRFLVSQNLKSFKSIYTDQKALKTHLKIWQTHKTITMKYRTIFNYFIANL